MVFRWFRCPQCHLHMRWHCIRWIILFVFQLRMCHQHYSFHLFSSSSLMLLFDVVECGFEGTTELTVNVERVSSWCCWNGIVNVFRYHLANLYLVQSLEYYINAWIWKLWFFGMLMKNVATTLSYCMYEFWKNTLVLVTTFLTSNKL